MQHSVKPGNNLKKYYHTRVFLFRSVVEVDIFIEGEVVYPTIDGYNAKELQNTNVNGEKSFVIAHAEDKYSFTSDNSKESATGLVRFALSELDCRLFTTCMDSRTHCTLFYDS